MALYDYPIFRIMGDRSVLVDLGDEISPAVNQRVQELFTAMDLHRSKGILDLVPSYRSLMVIYDPLRISLNEIKELVLGFAPDVPEEVVDGSNCSSRNLN